MKFTTYCPLNRILDATKINPLKCRTCIAIRNTHYDEHFGQFVTAVRRPKSPLTTTRSFWLKDKHCLLIGSCFDALSFSLFSPLYFMIMERSSPRNTVAYCSDRLRKWSILIRPDPLRFHPKQSYKMAQCDYKRPTFFCVNALIRRQSSTPVQDGVHFEPTPGYRLYSNIFTMASHTPSTDIRIQYIHYDTTASFRVPSTFSIISLRTTNLIWVTNRVVK